MYAYSNILAALLQRGQTGKGQHIDISMLESLAEWTSYPLYYAFEGAPPPPRTGAAPRDDLSLWAVSRPATAAGDAGPAERARMGQLLREGAAAARARAATRASPATPSAWPSARRCASSSSRPSQPLTAPQVVERLEAAQIANAQVNTMHEVWAHPQLKARGRWREVGSPAGHAARDAAARHLGRRARAWTRCPRSASTPTRSCAELGIDAEGVAHSCEPLRRHARHADPRTYLFVPGNRPERFAKALASGADAVVLDLEDAVAPTAKAEARDAIAQLGRDSRARPTARASSCASTTPQSAGFADDLRLLRDARIAGVMLPKAESAAQVDAVRAAVPDARVLALIESARGVANAHDVAGAAGVARLVFGTLDFALDLDLDIADSSEGLAHAASVLAIASRVAGLPAPVAGVTPQIDDEPRLLADLAWSRRHGFGAKLCIHPRQVAPIHAALRAERAGARLGAARARRRGGITRRRAARRPNGRPPGRAAGATHAAARRRLNPSQLHQRETPPCPPPSSTPPSSRASSASDAMRHVWSDENRTAEVPRHRSARWPRCRAGSASSRRKRPTRSSATATSTQIDMAKLRQQTERIGYPILGVVSQLNALCRDKLGEYCHWGATTQDITDTADRAADPRGPGARRARPGGDLGRAGRAREAAPRHADDRPQQPAAGHSGDLRLQDGRRSSPAIERHRERLRS